MRRTSTLLVVAVTAILLAGCGDSRATAQAVHTASNGDAFNDADAAFARHMVQHHAQALVMVDDTVARRLDHRVQRLVDDIRQEQVAEIEQLTAWLIAWGKPEPPTVRDHEHADNGGHVDMGDMPGVLSDQQMGDLKAARGQEFLAMWLGMMIEHHEGAIEMARSEEDGGHSKRAVEMAKAIQRSEAAQLSLMKRLRAQTP